MGTTVSNKMLLCGHQQEEPCEGRLSRTVLWEALGEIPGADPIRCNTADNNQITINDRYEQRRRMEKNM